MDKAPRLLVGLGNPADSYHNTRHNVGRQFIDFLKTQTQSSYIKSRQVESFRVPAFFRPGETVVFARPLSYMNESGPAIKRLLEQEGVGIDDLLVIVDDFMIPFGSLRLRPSGSAGGHNGVKSVIETFQTEDFARLRIGIGPVPPGGDPADFVLEKFKKNEIEALPPLFEKIRDGLTVFSVQGIDKVMNAMNKQHL